METDLVFLLTNELYTQSELISELEQCRNAIVTYFLTSSDNDKEFCTARYTALTQLIECLKNNISDIHTLQ